MTRFRGRYRPWRPTRVARPIRVNGRHDLPAPERRGCAMHKKSKPKSDYHKFANCVGTIFAPEFVRYACILIDILTDSVHSGDRGQRYDHRFGLDLFRETVGLNHRGDLHHFVDYEEYGRKRNLVSQGSFIRDSGVEYAGLWHFDDLDDLCPWPWFQDGQSGHRTLCG